ncbi:MAG: type II toxin-antitoxin system HicA family toxin [Verrucomicrobiales bacterium]|jgi:predicted RNA binding protein YcfA (HicA-like mRNA interferase family)|nr:type II toxin-antitoxin system HicA family toxin [Verrucomicrobiales bacterium]
MPKKIRELEQELKHAGFVWESGKGSHRKWRHASGVAVFMSGQPGHDAQRYQEKQVRLGIEESKK